MPILQLDPDKPMGRKMQQLQTRYYLMLGFPLVLFMVAYLQAEQPNFEPKVEQNTLANLVVWAACGTLAFYAWRSFNVSVRRINKDDTMEEKFARYKKSCSKSYVVLVIAMLLTAAGLLMSGIVLYGALFSVILIIMASIRPTAEQFIERMQLTAEEQGQLLHQE